MSEDVCTMMYVCSIVLSRYTRVEVTVIGFNGYIPDSDCKHRKSSQSNNSLYPAPIKFATASERYL